MHYNAFYTDRCTAFEFPKARTKRLIVTDLEHILPLNIKY